MSFPNFNGSKCVWTRERVMAGLIIAAKELDFRLPCLDASYSRLKKGHYDWPPARRVLEYFGAISRGWLAVGEPRARVSLHNVPWTEKERTYLLEYAGIHTLKQIARRLHRNYAAVRGQLRILKIASRHNQGFLSAAELSKEYKCPYHRVRDALSEGHIKGRYDELRNRWEVDLADLTPSAISLLTRPKLHSWRTTPPDLGDYYQRHNLMRKLINGKVLTLEIA